MNKTYVWIVSYSIDGEEGEQFDGVYGSPKRAQERVDELNEYAGLEVAKAKREELQ